MIYPSKDLHGEKFVDLHGNLAKSKMSDLWKLCKTERGGRTRVSTGGSPSYFGSINQRITIFPMVMTNIAMGNSP